MRTEHEGLESILALTPCVIIIVNPPLVDQDDTMLGLEFYLLTGLQH